MDSSHYYSDNSQAFVAQTVEVDMSEHRARFLGGLPEGAAILDAGSGAGRDALAFRIAGYHVAAFDASPEMVKATRELARIPTRVLQFEAFQWEKMFDGIWACASLLHVSRKELPKVLSCLAGALQPKGMFYASFKFGREERQKDGRYFNDMTPETLALVLDAVPELIQSQIWVSADQRFKRKGEKWLNVIMQKSAHLQDD